MLPENLLRSPSVVLVHADDYCGTGWFVTNSLVVTCYHILDDADGPPPVVLLILYTGEIVEAVVMGVDPDNDVAVLRTVTPNRGQPLSIGFSGVSWGEYLEVWGHPGCGPPYRIPGTTDLAMTAWGGVCLTHAVASGSSGSPVLNQGGEVVGMVQRMFKHSQRAIMLPQSRLREAIGRCLR